MSLTNLNTPDLPETFIQDSRIASFFQVSLHAEWKLKFVHFARHRSSLRAMKSKKRKKKKQKGKQIAVEAVHEGVGYIGYSILYNVWKVKLSIGKSTGARWPRQRQI